MYVLATDPGTTTRVQRVRFSSIETQVVTHTKWETFLIVKHVQYTLLKLFEFFMEWLWSQNMQLYESREFSDQFFLFLWLFIELLRNKCENIIKWLGKSKKLHSHMILVYEHHIKN
jgi:hypothetical protein